MLKSIKFKISLAIFLLGIVGFAGYKKYEKTYRPELSVFGYFVLEDGLGRQCAELIDTFKDEFSINAFLTRRQKLKEIPSKYRPFIAHNSSRHSGKVAIYEDAIWMPGNKNYKKAVNAHKDSIMIAYSMWESSRLPSEWVKIFNTSFDAIIVPSEFLIDVYKQSGVKIPVFLLPLGLDLKKWLKEPLKEQCGSPMVFANMSACNDRKNQLLLVRAFLKAFGNDPTVELHINYRWGDTPVRRKILKELAKQNVSNIFFTQFHLSQDEYFKFFKKIDCYVSPSKGEGFSIQPREAMALGIPVILTNNTGQKDICKHANLVRVVESPIAQPAVYPWDEVPYGHNYTCTVDELAEALKDVRDNYQFYLSNNYEGRNFAKQYQFDQLKDLYRTIIHPKKIALGEENRITKDILFTNSVDLYKKYKKSFADVEEANVVVLN